MTPLTALSPMTDADGMVLSFVERGWQAAREWSLDAQHRGITVVHLIKGRLSPAVQAMIAPRPHIRIMSVPRPLFWVAAFAHLFAGRLRGRLRAVLVDNDRSCHRLRAWTQGMGVTLLTVRVGAAGYELWNDAGRAHL